MKAASGDAGSGGDLGNGADVPPPTATQPTGTPIDQAAVGTCFNKQSVDDSNGAYLDPIDCTQQHDSEVFFSGNVTDTSYPDSAGWQQDVMNLCHPAFKTYTGLTYGQNAWQLSYVYPSADAWDAGNHSLVCYTTDPLGRTSSVKAKS